MTPSTLLFVAEATFERILEHSFLLRVIQDYAIREIQIHQESSQDLREHWFLPCILLFSLSILRMSINFWSCTLRFKSLCLVIRILQMILSLQEPLRNMPLKCTKKNCIPLSPWPMCSGSKITNCFLKYIKNYTTSESDNERSGSSTIMETLFLNILNHLTCTTTSNHTAFIEDITDAVLENDTFVDSLLLMRSKPVFKDFVKFLSQLSINSGEHDITSIQQTLIKQGMFLEFLLKSISDDPNSYNDEQRTYFTLLDLFFYNSQDVACIIEKMLTSAHRHILEVCSVLMGDVLVRKGRLSVFRPISLFQVAEPSLLLLEGAYWSALYQWGYYRNWCHLLKGQSKRIPHYSS